MNIAYTTCGCGPLLCMAGVLVPFSNEMITGVRGLVGPLLYMVELSNHHLINAGQHEQSLINSINIILNIFKYTFN